MLSRMTAEFTSVSHGPSATLPKDDAALPMCRFAKPQSDTPAGGKKIDFCHRVRAGRDHRSPGLGIGTGEKLDRPTSDPPRRAVVPLEDYARFKVPLHTIGQYKDGVQRWSTKLE